MKHFMGRLQLTKQLVYDECYIKDYGPDPLSWMQDFQYSIKITAMIALKKLAYLVLILEIFCQTPVDNALSHLSDLKEKRTSKTQETANIMSSYGLKPEYVIKQVNF